MATRSSLETQCQMIGWGLSTLSATKAGEKAWSYEGTDNLRPEEVVARAVAAADGDCSWCEGGSINLLLKAAALPVLARRNSFSDRQDAVRRFLEAQLAILSAFGAELIDCAVTISPAELQSNILDICADSFIQEAYPRVRVAFVCRLATAVPVALRARMLQTYLLKPYDYRAGWPDLTVLDSDGLSFIEVKTTDRFHDSQLRLAGEVAATLGLRCKVVQVIPRL
jgi:hypothetical protein